MPQRPRPTRLSQDLPDDLVHLTRLFTIEGVARVKRVRFVDAEFEELDGSPVILDVDLTGTPKVAGETYPAGPLAALTAGQARIRIW